MRRILAGLFVLAAAIPALAQNQPTDEAAPPAPEAPDVVKPLLDRATAAVTSDATKPADIDTILTDIEAAITDQRSTRGPDYQRNFQQLQAARQFMKQWQTYLVDKTAGNGRGQMDLQNLANIEGVFAPIPRSKLLERAMSEGGASPSGSPDIQLDSFDDLPAAMQKLEAMQRGGNFSMQTNGLENSLQNLNSAYGQYANKDYTQALQMLGGGFGPGLMRGGASSPALASKLEALKNQLEMKIVAGMLNLPSTPALDDGETPQDFMLGLADHCSKAADWPGLQQVLTVYQQAFAFQPQPWLQDDLAGLRALLIGDKLEGAGQHLDAIRSYRQALATLGKYFPAAPAQDKLDAMAKKYPDDYKQALEQPIGPKTL